MIGWLFACSGGPGASHNTPVVAEPIGEAACAVCGMIVGEQPSPRGQIVYRDGTHDHVCSVEELRAVDQNPSSRGRPVGLFVEIMPDDVDPLALDRTEHPWAPVEDTWFVFGVARKGIMGTPVLTFDDEAAATVQATAVGSHPLRWKALHDTPFPAVPDAAGIKPQ